MSTFFSRKVPCVFVFCAVIASASGAADPILSSYWRALEILELGVASMGGRPAVAALHSVSLEYDGTSWARGQSAAPHASPYPSPVRGEAVIDIRGGRFYHFMDLTIYGGIRLEVAAVWNRTDGFVASLSTGEAFPLSVAELGALKRQAPYYPNWMVPQAVLNSALQARDSLRYVGQWERDGQRWERVSFNDPNGVEVTLSFVAPSYRLAGLAILASDLSLGDEVGSVEYGEWQLANGSQLPHVVTYRIGGKKIEERRLTYRPSSGEVDASRFSLPEGIELRPRPAPFLPEELAPGVYFLHVSPGLVFTYNTMIVVLSEGVVVFDAPLGDPFSAAVANVTRTLAPGRDIKYVVATHYHHDHIAGFRAHASAGRTILAPTGLASYLKELAGVPHTLIPQEEVSELSVEEVVGRKILGDENRRLILFELAPTPHVDRMLLGYLPVEKILWVTDLFSAPVFGDFQPTNESWRFLAEKLIELELDVETIVPAHGRPVTIEEFRRAVAGG